MALADRIHQLRMGQENSLWSYRNDDDMATVKCEWPDGCENKATKSWPSGEPCPHVMICNSHDNVKVGDSSAGALFSLWTERVIFERKRNDYF